MWAIENEPTWGSFHFGMAQAWHGLVEVVLGPAWTCVRAVPRPEVQPSGQHDMACLLVMLNIFWIYNQTNPFTWCTGRSLHTNNLDLRFEPNIPPFLHHFEQFCALKPSVSWANHGSTANLGMIVVTGPCYGGRRLRLCHASARPVVLNGSCWEAGRSVLGWAAWLPSYSLCCLLRCSVVS
jgi:hypothetical protein